VYSVINGDLEMVKLLVENNAELERVDEHRNSALHYACFIGSLDMVKYFIENGKIDPKVINEYGDTLLHFACRGGNVEVVKYLCEITPENLEAKVYYNGQSPLFFACRLWEFFDYNLEFPIPIWLERLEGLSTIDEIKKRIKIVKYLIDERGAKLNTTDNYGNTILHQAVQFESEELVCYLVGEKGVDVDARNEKGEIPLHFACQFGNLKVVKYLIQRSKSTLDARDYRQVSISSTFTRKFFVRKSFW